MKRLRLRMAYKQVRYLDSKSERATIYMEQKITHPPLTIRLPFLFLFLISRLLI